MIEVTVLSGSEARQQLGALAEVLVDCVEGGASVNFLWPYAVADATAFFEGVLKNVERNERILIAAFIGPQLVGTVQLVLATPPNQRHRGEIAKLLVHRSARCKGVASQLMMYAEKTARSAGKTLLTLDTVTGSDAERLYAQLGWTKAGAIPNYCLFPDGTLCGTTIFLEKPSVTTDKVHCTRTVDDQESEAPWSEATLRKG